MASVALILIAAIPTTYTVIGIILIAFALTFAALFVWKLYEAKTLRKEVVELRDTMRMMRYEEANLARMLHIADKSEEPNATQENVNQPTHESIEYPTESETEEITEKESPKVTEDTKESVEDTISAEDVEKETNAETTEEEGYIKVSIEEQATENTLPTDEESSSAVIKEPESEERAPLTKSRKQTIKERCPAIPNDLFSAWFEENESSTHPANSVETDEGTPSPDDDSQSTSETPTINEESATNETAEDNTNHIHNKEPEAEEKTQELTAPSTLSKEDERFCRKLERTIHTRMRDPNLNIDIIASQFGIGRTNFYRKVREITGMSPNDYLRKYRMTKAAELLQTSEMAISDICIQVGIPDAQYFSRVFKIYFGVTPSMYREQ